MLKNVPAPDEAKLRKAHSGADEKGKKLLETMYPEVFTPRSPMEWVNTFELLCQAAGVDVADYEVLPAMTYKQKADKCMYRLMLLELVFNQGVPIVRAEIKQRKWYPYFNVIPDTAGSGGFRLSFGDSGCAAAYAVLGARPEFVEQRISDFVGKTFVAEYEAWAQNFQLSKSNP